MTEEASPSSSSEQEFGDLLAQLLQSLPAEASRLFLQSLSGLSPSESGELCRYVDRLGDEKQFRVIKAMAESTVDGKKKFLLNLRKKFAVQQQQMEAVQAREDKDMESFLKRKQELDGQLLAVWRALRVERTDDGDMLAALLQPRRESRCSTRAPTASTRPTPLSDRASPLLLCHRCFLHFLIAAITM